MKKFLFAISVIIHLFLCGCQTNQDIILNSLPEYTDAEIYGGVDFREGMIYGKYYFTDEAVSSIQNNEYFEVVTEDNIEEVEGYFRNYAMHLQYDDISDVKKDYDFVYGTDIQNGDYFYAYTIEGQKSGESTYGKYDTYSVYYFDVDRLTLFYVQCNV